MEKRIETILRMEAYYDSVQAALAAEENGLETNDSLREMLRELTGYYDSGRWMADYELDEQGLLPPELKRGVLSQDGLYNLLCELNENET